MSASSMLIFRRALPFLVAGILIYLGLRTAAIVVLVLGVFVGILDRYFPRLYNRLWATLGRVGKVMGNTLSLILMGLIYWCAVTPGALISRSVGRHPPHLPRAGQRTYWIDRDRPTAPIERMFLYESRVAAGVKTASGIRLFARTLLVSLSLILVLDITGGHMYGVARQALAGNLPFERRIYIETIGIGYDATPHVFWRSSDHDGNLIHVDRGIRATYRSSVTTERQLRVFFFGGSTMWGFGARDEHTIASEVVKEAERAGLSWEAVNYGERGYVSWQSVIMLAELCASGEAPDVVVFYDGYNDSWARYHKPEVARPFFDQVWFETLMQGMQGKSVRVGLLLVKDAYVRNSLMLRVARRLIINSRGTQDESGDDKIGMSVTRVEELQGLGRDVGETYLRNMKFVEAMASSCGFHRLSVWQPTLATKFQMTSDEMAVWAREGSPGRETALVIRSATDIVGNDPSIINLSRVFDATNTTVFTDAAHIVEAQNRVVAEAIFHEIRKLLGDTTSDSDSP